MTYLHKSLATAVVALLLWSSRQSPFRDTGLGALAVVGAIAWVAYVLTRGLRTLVLPGFDLRERPVRRDARWLACANGLLAVGLVEESQRLAEAFWWKCGLFPAALALGLLLRLAFSHALHRSPFAGHIGDLARPSSSGGPYISVQATATHAPSASGAASVSIRF